MNRRGEIFFRKCDSPFVSGQILNQCANKPDVPSLPTYLQQIGAVGTAIAAAAQAANTHFLITAKGGGRSKSPHSPPMYTSLYDRNFIYETCLNVSLTSQAFNAPKYLYKSV